MATDMHRLASSMDWSGPNSSVAQHAVKLSQQCLAAYRANPLLIVEHANIELATAQGGYGRRQLYELIQNGADALVRGSRGRIAVVLTDTALYCANEGAPIDVEGVEALLASHVSMKRGTEIGRFGLGFKSVLGVTRHPEFYSRSGSFEFDAIDSRRRIREISDSSVRFPTLRLAEPVNPRDAARNDPILAELMDWATTVVRLPGGATAAPWLSNDLDAFPSEFLLFSPHVSLLQLQDRSKGLSKEVVLSEQGDEVELSTAGRSSRWRVFSRMHRPSDAARADAGELANRELIPIVWAVSLANRREDGRFWAFFPTEYRTTLSGILNAPWKTNEDRQNLLPGAFNEELIGIAAEMVGEAIPELYLRDDPGRYLDLLPARGRETRNWADERITRAVYEALAGRPSVPDQDGILRAAEDVRLSPEKVPAEVLQLWTDAPGRPADWAHPATATRDDRRSRIERLVTEAGGAAASVTAWLEALVADVPDVAASSAAAVRVAAALVAAVPSVVNDIKRAAIVLTTTGRLVVPEPRTVFLPGERSAATSVTMVAQALVDDLEARAALERLGLQRIDPVAELESMVSRGVGQWSDTDWEEFWSLCRDIEPADAEPALRRILSPDRQRADNTRIPSNRVSTAVRVRTVSGQWRPINRTLLPGPIVPSDGSRDAGVAIDEAFHSDDLALIRRLGGTPAAEVWDQAESEEWFRDYRQDCVADFIRNLPAGSSHPLPEYLEFVDERTLGPLSPLDELSPDGRAAFTHALLDAADAVPDWTLRHLTRAYPEVPYPAPSTWVVRRSGSVRTTLGIRRVDEAIGPGLKAFGLTLPIAQVSARQAQVLNLPGAFADLTSDQWSRAFTHLSRVDDDLAIGQLYASAAEVVAPPDLIRCRVASSHTSLIPSEVCVTADRDEFRALTNDGVIAVVLAPNLEARDRLISRWGLRTSEEQVTRRLVFASSDPAVPLDDEFPSLHWHLDESQAALRLQRCTDLRVEIVTTAGKTQLPFDFLIEGDVIYASDRLDQTDLLTRIVDEMRLEVDRDQQGLILQQRDTAQQRHLIVNIREQPNDSARLLVSVGADAIRRHLPGPLLNAVEDMHGSLSDERLADIALAMYGVDALHEFRDILAERGLDPPAMWAGSSAAMQFVRSLGFSSEFAGAGSQTREPFMDVDGPSALPNLHPYQEEIALAVRALLQTTEERRALIALPTGAGKTRVAVQALVEAARDDGFRGPVLWVADRDELCEQAVQSWAEVWRAIGPVQRLHINRLWSANEAAPTNDAFQVVVATIQKLSASADNANYDWLADVGCLVVDEAHSSIGPQHTELLNKVGFGRSQRRDRALLLGLTATPFRGVSSDETERLVNRYGARRLDTDVLGSEPELRLQEMGVLAQVDHELLPGDDIELTADQLDELRRLRRLPALAEQQLGASVKRNRTLLESIGKLPSDWPVLLFATSVEHAQTMAALLTLAGISAAAVSAETPSAARRAYVDRFRRGELRVLANYGVLTQGFDAPSVRAVYLARPTYSPNLYQQMIGRGLRGPANGGKERCLVVNVQDNIDQYGERLAFHHFDYLWTHDS